MKTRSRTQSKKLNTSSVTLKSRLKERRQTKIDSKAAESKAFKSVIRSTSFRDGDGYWTVKEHNACMKAI